ncbi:hypothetical protein EKO24_000985 [Candidatus Methylobacter oryzae]|uniref:Uncharacterized protein n=1 Tax=Candidatus Methylobacter oryzae TaxID=2497749 RepID=A0ABY3CGQ0_9GAMM|nr:hypothetical protein EKO24_000985 [Candidatus Methylobacter oryzae]
MARIGSRLPRRAPELSAEQIGRIADLHAQHPKGEVQGLYRVITVRGAVWMQCVAGGWPFWQPPCI